MENVTIIICTAYAALWLMAMLRNLSYRHTGNMVKRNEALPMPQPADLPPLSIVIATHEQSEALRNHLPHILEQEYPQNFEVIVVDMNSTDDTLAYLESIKGRYPQLHVTQIPHSARNVSRSRLALMLGIRAASHDWIVLTQPDCCPTSPNWLLRMGQACGEKCETKMVLGYTQFEKSKGWTALRCRFFRLWQQMLHLPYAARWGAYQADGTNLCYRRSLFFEHRGFAGHDELLMGATDIMVNQNSTPQNTVLCLHPEAFMRQDSPRHASWWRQERQFFMETRRHFHRRWLYRLKYLCHACLTWAFTLSTIVMAATLLTHQDYVLAGIGLVLWAIHAAVRSYSFHRNVRLLGERSFFPILPLLLHLVSVWDGMAWIHWLFTKKRTFQKNFI